MGATMIRSRVNPCGCGCKGRDSQHAAVFMRVVRNIRNIEPRDQQLKFGGTYTVFEEGDVTLPQGVEVVYHATFQGSDMGWYRGV